MIKTFTQNDVVRFVYDEVSTEERSQFNELMLIDADFQEMYFNYTKTKVLISKSKLEPSENVINRILTYSKSLSLQQ
ncbi:hypothetical protein [Cytophaga aurantiaca]|uniref:hypothetical protein n=1 Tax=Cytophaga aurantiaca TaxID=29530 RepID=UPI00037814BB|nr:hypothetical protein [Cytophaga aurantiaca]